MQVKRQMKTKKKNKYQAEKKVLYILHVLNVLILNWIGKVRHKYSLHVLMLVTYFHNPR